MGAVELERGGPPRHPHAAFVISRDEFAACLRPQLTSTAAALPTVTGEVEVFAIDPEIADTAALLEATGLGPRRWRRP